MASGPVSSLSSVASLTSNLPSDSDIDFIDAEQILKEIKELNDLNNEPTFKEWQDLCSSVDVSPLDMANGTSGITSTSKASQLSQCSNGTDLLEGFTLDELQDLLLTPPQSPPNKNPSAHNAKIHQQNPVGLAAIAPSSHHQGSSFGDAATACSLPSITSLFSNEDDAFASGLADFESLLLNDDVELLGSFSSLIEPNDLISDPHERLINDCMWSQSSMHEAQINSCKNGFVGGPSISASRSANGVRSDTPIGLSTSSSSSLLASMNEICPLLPTTNQHIDDFEEEEQGGQVVAEGSHDSEDFEDEDYDNDQEEGDEEFEDEDEVDKVRAPKYALVQAQERRRKGLANHIRLMKKRAGGRPKGPMKAKHAIISSNLNKNRISSLSSKSKIIDRSANHQQQQQRLRLAAINNSLMNDHSYGATGLTSSPLGMANNKPTSIINQSRPLKLSSNSQSLLSSSLANKHAGAKFGKKNPNSTNSSKAYQSTSSRHLSLSLSSPPFSLLYRKE